MCEQGQRRVCSRFFCQLKPVKLTYTAGIFSCVFYLLHNTQVSLKMLTHTCYLHRMKEMKSFYDFLLCLLKAAWNTRCITGQTIFFSSRPQRVTAGAAALSNQSSLEVWLWWLLAAAHPFLLRVLLLSFFFQLVAGQLAWKISRLNDQIPREKKKIGGIYLATGVILIRWQHIVDYSNNRSLPWSLFVWFVCFLKSL